MSIGLCKIEMRSIIREIRAIEAGIRSDFTGIGEQLCGDYIEKQAIRYDGISKKLDDLTQEYINSLIDNEKDRRTSGQAGKIEPIKSSTGSNSGGSGQSPAATNNKSTGTVKDSSNKGGARG